MLPWGSSYGSGQLEVPSSKQRFLSAPREKWVPLLMARSGGQICSKGLDAVIQVTKVRRVEPLKVPKRILMQRLRLL